MTAILPFARRAPGRPPETPDVAHAALRLFAKLRDALQSAVRFRDEVRRLEVKAERKQWGVPRLFFFNSRSQAEWGALRPPGPQFPGPLGEQAAYRDRAGAAAWHSLHDLADDTLTVLAACHLTRRAARSFPGLTAAAAALSTHHAKARELAELLTMPEDEVLLVIHPAARAGYRVMTRGVSDLHQFHVLLADAITGDPSRGLLPGPRPDRRVLDVYRDRSPDSDEVLVAVGQYQFFHPLALQPDGTLPSGFAGSDNWLRGRDSLSVIPRVGEERTMLIGAPTFRETWDAARKLPLLRGELELVEMLSATAVAEWIAEQTGRPVVAWPETGRRAA